MEVFGGSRFRVAIRVFLISRIAKMSREWRASTVIPLYKNKGDIQDCNNFGAIKLLSHTMKLWERVIERRLRKNILISENQFGFMPGRSTIGDLPP